MLLQRQTLAIPPLPLVGAVFSAVSGNFELEVLRTSRQHFSIYAVKLLFGDAVDAIENLLIYSTKPAILETNENESLRAW